MSTAVCSSSSVAAAGDESKIVVPRLFGATDELLSCSYRILDQCLTLCDAVEEVKRTVSAKVPSHATVDDEDSDEQEELADTLSTWRVHLGNVGSSLVQLTADIRLSSLVKQNDVGDEKIGSDSESASRGINANEMAMIKRTLSNFGAYDTLDGLQNELARAGDLRRRPSIPNMSKTVAYGVAVRPGNGRKKLHYQSHHNHHHRHQFQQQRRRRASRSGASTSHDVGPLIGQAPTERGSNQDGERKSSPPPAFAALDYGALMPPVPPTTFAPTSAHRRAQHPQLQRQINASTENICNTGAVNGNRLSTLGKDVMRQPEVKKVNCDSGKGEVRLMARRRRSTDPERRVISQAGSHGEPEVVQQKDVPVFPEVRCSIGGGGNIYCIGGKKSEFGSATAANRAPMFRTPFKSSCFKGLLADLHRH